MILSRLFASKPLVVALSVAFSGSVSAAGAWAPQSAFTCPHGTGVARYAPPPKPAEALPEQATRISADKIVGQTQVGALAEGDVVVERGSETLQAQRVEYDQRSDTVHAAGGVTLSRSDGSTVSGEDVSYNLNEGSGSASAAEFAAQHEGKRLQGRSDRITMNGKSRYRAENTRFNTCNPGDNSWYIQAATLDADQNSGIGTVKHARLVFGGVPVLYTPWADFPLHGNRKSGVLVPSVKIGSNGTEVELPYYFNLAPNYDATVSPGIISARGATIGGEVRYLQPKYQGSARVRYMPHDRRSPHDNRYEVRLNHRHRFGSKLSGGVTLNQVSDDDYYRDFYGRNDVAENVQLDRRAWLDYQTELAGAPLYANLTLQKYQTLSDATGRKTQPYALLPRLSAQWRKHGRIWQFDTAAQLTRFEHKQRQTGSRLSFYPSVQADFNNGWAYIRPKAGLHATYYWLDGWNGSPKRQTSRILPIANIDAGMHFERETAFSRRRYLQTLEPRLFYNYIPVKAQNRLPDFDTSENHFSYAQLFRENRFSGGDRINSSNSLAFGLQTRLLDRYNGAEYFRAGIGQKFYFNTDSVMLDGSVSATPRRKSDIAAFAGGRVSGNWFADAHLHYNQHERHIQRADIGARYNPEAGKVLALRYKYGRREEIYTGHYDRLRHVDFAFQWPVNANLYALGRLNYSIKPRTTLEQMLGLEYRSSCGCWSASVVGQRYLSGINRHKTAVFLTLQLKDLSSIGSNPYQQLRLGIPGYHKTNEVNTP